MEAVAGDRLHDFRQQIVGEAAEEVGDEARPALRSSSACIGTRIAGPPTMTCARAKAGAWPQLTIPPTAPFASIEATCTERPSSKIDDQRDHRRAEWEVGSIHVWSRDSGR